MGLVDRALRSPRLRATFYRLSKVSGVNAVQRAVARRILPVGATRWVTLRTGLNAGLEMQVDPRSELGYARGDHEPWLQDLLRSELGHGATFLDVGSHVGFFAMAASGLVGPDGTVIALEPDPLTFARLERHLRRNALANVQPIKAAAWSRSDVLRFASTVGSDAGVTGHVAETAATEVRALSIDEVLAGRTPALVKIDVEGAELEALAGAVSTIARHMTVWIVETHGDALREQTLGVFLGAGYVAEAIAPRHAVYRDYLQDYVMARPTAR